MRTKSIFLIICILILSCFNLYSQYRTITIDELKAQGHTFINNKPDATMYDTDFISDLDVISTITDNDITLEVHKMGGIPRYGIVFDNLGNLIDTISYFDNSTTRQIISGLPWPYIYNDYLELTPFYPVNIIITDIITGEKVLEEVAKLPDDAFIEYHLSDSTLFSGSGMGNTRKILKEDEEPYQINYKDLPMGHYFISFFNPTGKMIYLKTLNKN